MDININSKLIQDSKDIEIGIQYLQNQLNYVINRYTEKNPNEKETLNKISSNLKDIKIQLKSFISQQKDVEAIINAAEAEVNSVENEIDTLIQQNGIQIDRNSLIQD